MNGYRLYDWAVSHICSKCVNESGLRDYVESQEGSEECAFCGNQGEDVATAPTEEVIDYVIQQILLHYEDPANSVGYASSEGGYLLPTMDSQELLEEVGLERADEDFIGMLIDRLDNECGIWTKQDPYASSYHEQLGYDWEAFSREVKNRTRFTFFLSSPKQMRDGDTAVEQAFEVLYHIGHIAEVAQTFIDLDTNTPIYRGREHDSSLTISEARDIGSPPDADAKQSRMSPAGVSMFYGALDIATVTAELQSAGKTVTVGTFKPRRRLYLADFSRSSWEASIFGYETTTEYDAAVFLNRFAREIAQPIIRDDRVHIDYVPTQVITEYFRFLFPKEHTKIDGIAFRSSLHSGGINVVLFADQNDWPEMLTLESITRISPES